MLCLKYVHLKPVRLNSVRLKNVAVPLRLHSKGSCFFVTRGGTSPIFSSPSRARAFKVEPGRASSLLVKAFEPASGLTVNVKTLIFLLN